MAAVTWRRRTHRPRSKLAANVSKRPEQPTRSVAQTVSASTSAYCGADGRYHFLYRTEHKETGEFYLGKHSTRNLNDGYQGSGDWIKYWRTFARRSLKTIPLQFFDSEEAAYAGEKAFLTPEIINDPLCQNLNEGGDGRTSEEMRRTLARPEIKERHRAGVLARWAVPEERDRASKAQLDYVAKFGTAKYVAGSTRRFSKPEEHEKVSRGQLKRYTTPGEREKARQRRLAYLAANPDANALNSRQKKEQWNDPVWREKILAAQMAGKAKMLAGPRAKRVETPEGVFPSLTAAAKHFGISRKRGERQVKKGRWCYVLTGCT
jgi:hypothetical protein